MKRQSELLRYGSCSVCGKYFALRVDGTVYGHRPAKRGTGLVLCAGSRLAPNEAGER